MLQYTVCNENDAYIVDLAPHQFFADPREISLSSRRSLLSFPPHGRETGALLNPVMR